SRVQAQSLPVALTDEGLQVAAYHTVSELLNHNKFLLKSCSMLLLKYLAGPLDGREAGLGVPGREILKAYGACKPALLDLGEQIAEVNLSGPRLVPVRGVRQVDVGDDVQVLIDILQQVPVH